MGAVSRRVPIGAEVFSQPADRGAHFRVWAPTHEKITLVLESPMRRELVMQREASGHHAMFVEGVAPGARYRFRIGSTAGLHADPASRFQPEGPFGPSELVDPAGHAWSDAAWTGIDPRGHVFYELHLGTFTPEGTWAAAAEHLGFLADVGVTTLELLPVADFAGAHNWGYDGVNLWAPSHHYGTPDDMRRFVDRAHAAGLAVILDVVYNHFGPAGSSMIEWSPYYQAERATEWGAAIDFDGPHSAGVREYFVANAAYWVDEFHLDGLRLDATQTIADRSPERGGEHVLAAMATRVRAAGRGRRIVLVGENEPQDIAMLGGAISLDALWNDDFHHTARVALTDLIEGYLHDYGGTPQELISTFKRGFLYQGQMYPWQRKPRGTPTRGVPPSRFVHYLENHDQVANLGFGERLGELADPASLRAMTAVLLLGPELPLLFQGQETGARRPWQFFCDHGGELADAVRRGRAAFVAQFARLATPAAQARLADPCDPATFRACILDPAERTLANPHVRLHRDLLRLRREDPAFTGGTVDGALLGTDAFAIRYFTAGATSDRLLLVNLGRTFARGPSPEPLVAPPTGTGWRLAWSSEDPAYGGHGTPEVVSRERLAIPARAAVVLAPDPAARLAPEADPSRREEPA